MYKHNYYSIATTCMYICIHELRTCTCPRVKYMYRPNVLHLYMVPSLSSCRLWAACSSSCVSSRLHLESSPWPLFLEHSISQINPSTLKPCTLLYVSRCACVSWLVVSYECVSWLVVSWGQLDVWGELASHNRPLTHRPSSQGWASRCLLLHVYTCIYVCLSGLLLGMFTFVFFVIS